MEGMKTAEELYEKHKSKIETYDGEIRTAHQDFWCVFYLDFQNAITEDRKQIKDMIDEMIEGLKGECEDCGEDYNACSCVASIPIGEKIEALTELKDKLK